MSEPVWIDKDLGPVTAYAEAVAGGYTGTKEQFETDMGNSATNATNAANSADEAHDWANGGASGTPSATNNAKYYSEQAAGSATSAAASAATASDKYNVNLLAPNFVQENAYPAGQHVIYDGGYYVLPNGHEANTTWANTSKTQLTLGGEVGDLKSALFNNDNLLFNVTGNRSVLNFDNGESIPSWCRTCVNTLSAKNDSTTERYSVFFPFTVVSGKPYKIKFSISYQQASGVVNVPNFRIFESNKTTKVLEIENGVEYDFVPSSTSYYFRLYVPDQTEITISNAYISPVVDSVPYLSSEIGTISNTVNGVKSTVEDTIKDGYSSINFKYLYTEKFVGYYAGIANGKDMKLTADTGFVTYCFYSHADAGFYFNEAQTQNPDASTNYISIAVGHSPSGTWVDGEGTKTMECSSAERYRNINNNLPTVNDKLSAPNALICITVKPDMEFDIWSKGYQLTENIQNRPKTGLLSYDSVNSKIKIYVPSNCGYIEYDFIHSVDENKNADVWRVDKALIVNNSLDIIKDLTVSGEWECAIQIDGRPDFIGGILHGDEKLDSAGLTIIVDGEEIGVNEIYNNMPFSQLRFAERCNMYDPSNSSSFVGYHGSEHVFNAKGTPQLTVYQYVYWAGSYQIDRAYLAMLPIAKPISNKIWTDVGFSVKATANQTTQTGTERAYLFTDGEDVGCEFAFSLTDRQNNANKFFVTDNGRDDYNKCYYMIKNNTSVSSGDYWKTITQYNFDLP